MRNRRQTLKAIHATVAVSVLIAIIMASSVGVASEECSSRSSIDANPDLLSAYVVAWNAHKDWAKQQGKPIDETNLSSASESVYIVREGTGRILVVFMPRKPGTLGGGVEYSVDGKTFKLIEQRFPR